MPLFNQVYLGCTQLESATKVSYIKTWSDVFAQIATTDTEAKFKINDLENSELVSWSYDMKGEAETCVERCCELAHTCVDQFSKVSLSCMDDQSVYEDDSEIVGDLARFGRPAILDSQCIRSKLTRSGTERVTKRLARRISYVNYTSVRQFCHVGEKVSECKQGLFQDVGFA